MKRTITICLTQRKRSVIKRERTGRLSKALKELGEEGYISQAVHKICELVVKYDAVIAMEDLNFGFKKGRFKV